MKYTPLWKWTFIPAFVLFLGILSIGALFITHFLHEDLHEYFFIEDINNNVQQFMLMSHLSVEEIGHGDAVIAYENVLPKIDLSIKTIDAMLAGGTSMYGEVINPLQDSELIEIARSIRTQIIEFREYILQISKTGSNQRLDLKYDSVFNQFLAMSGKLDNAIETQQSLYQSRLRRIFLATLLLWSAIIFLSVAGLSLFELRRKKAETEVREKQRLIENITDTTPEIIYIYDLIRHHLLYANRGLQSILGYSLQEIQGMGEKVFENLIHPDDLAKLPISRGRYQVRDGEILETEYRVRNSKGEWLWLCSRDTVFSRTPEGQPEQILGAAQDITSHKRMERLLHLSRERYRSIVDDQTELICRRKPDNSINFVNNAFCLYFGRNRHDLLGSKFVPDIPEEDLEKTIEHYAALYRGNPVGSLEHRVILPDGDIRWLRWINRAITDPSGDIHEIQSVGQDITERKQTENELEKHRELLRELVDERTAELRKSNTQLQREIAEHSKTEEELKLMALFAELNPSPVLRFDIRGEVLMANPAALKILQLDTWTGLYSRVYLKSILPGIEEFDPAEFIRSRKIITHSTQLASRHFHFTFIALPELGIGHIYGSDITEKLKIEAEILRSSQLASIGELAAGVAHEINNPINGIINYAQILVDKAEAESTEIDAAQQIIHEGDRIAKIVSSLLTFARYDKEERLPVQIIDVLSESLALIKAQLKKEGIRLKLSFSPGLPEIHADFQQIEQVILNILNNARYILNQKYPGMHEDKVIEITADEDNSGAFPLVRLIIHDHGLGIPDSIRDTIMNPFVTTKPKGTGTGLGLSISHRIISDHGGSLRIESVPGKFTKVIIDLPAEPKMQLEKCS